jgi:uncharacterized protein YukE
MTLTVTMDDLEGMATLLTKQEDHFAELAGYTGSTCTAGSGMTNLMGLLAPKVDELAAWVKWKLGHTKDVLGQTVGDLQTARDLYGHTDDQSTERMNQLFDYPLGVRSLYREFTPWWAAVLPGTYEEAEWKPTPPPSGTDPGTSKLIEDRKGGLISNCEEYWATFGYDEETLVHKLITPITGDYARLYWLYEGYLNLGNATYNIAANMRRGIYEIAPRWNGVAATNFEWIMFCWQQGTGGLGDLMEMCSLAFKWIYEEATKLVEKITDMIQDVIYKHIPDIQEVLNRNPGSWPKLSCMAFYDNYLKIPDDIMPHAEWQELARRAHKLCEFVRTIVKTIHELVDKYETAKDKIAEIWDQIDQISHKGLGPWVQDRIAKDYRNHLVNLENPTGKFDPEKWDPRMGVWRNVLLPS